MKHLIELAEQDAIIEKYLKLIKILKQDISSKDELILSLETQLQNFKTK